MDIAHTCCVTGHRDIPPQKITPMIESMKQEVERAIENGYTHFISGFAAGVDLFFAEVVAALKDTYPITLEAAIPYPGRLRTRDQDFQRLIRQCDTVRTHSAEYSKGCYMIRNRYMVDSSSLVIAVHDGRLTGGTAATIRYARESGRRIREILL